ncbi:MAG: tRNA (5-methylaminomethyl-2-thiouridine)(34)-methyltransferase MnmD [Saprospiraceae bacterium]|nr:tRNA (5-methylaminomethyl-2-thiouridine)(34)-methyltransferase MnmD [Saprospiraceae bacterium]
MSTIIETQDGSHTLYSSRFGESYHSRYGAIQESRHVFISAGLFYVIPLRKEIRILEMGFGSGLNAFLSLLEAKKREVHLWYDAVEAYPIATDDAIALNYPAQVVEPDARENFMALHLNNWEEWHAITPFFNLRKRHMPIEQLDEEEQYDLVYYDAFAPSAQPELWVSPVLARIYRALKPGGVLVTYCAKGIVKRTLSELGFHVEALPGPPGKREMTRAIKNDRLI